MSPAWPLAAYPNGIVSYLENLRPALAKLGVNSGVVAGLVARDFKSKDVVDVNQHFHRSVWERLSDRLRGDAQGVGTIRAGRAIARSVLALDRDRRIDLIETEEGFGLAEHIPEFIDRPMVVRLHGPWFLNGPAMGAVQDAAFERRDRDEGAAIARADAITAPSQNVLDQTREHFGLPLIGAEVIPNPGPVVPDQRRWTRSGSTSNLVLFVGRFDRHKGGDLALDSFAKVARVQSSAQMIFAGPEDEGLLDDEGRRWSVSEYIAEKIPEESIRSRIRYLGRQTAAEIDQLRRQAAVTIVTSRYENFPMTILEAVAYGSPLVAAAVGGIPEIVAHGENGLLAEGGNAEAIAQGVLELFEAPERAEALGWFAAKDAADRFSPDSVAKQTAHFYERVPGLDVEKG